MSVRYLARTGTLAVSIAVSAAAGGAMACTSLLGLTDVPVAADASPSPTSLSDGSPPVDASIAIEAGGGDATSSREASATGIDGGTDAGMPRDGGATGCDAQADPHNCGACGHDCLGGQCAGGMCQPLVLWPPDGGGFVQPYDLAQDDTFLYWTDIANHTVLRTNKTTGETTDLVGSKYLSVVPRGVAIDDAGAVYWGDLGVLLRCPKTGCVSDPVEVASVGANGVYGLAVDDVSVYWSEDTPQVFSAHKLGSNETPTTLWKGAAAAANKVATDGERVYFTSDDGLLHAVPPDGGAGFTIGSSSGTDGGAPTLGLTLQGGVVYWTVFDPAHGQVLGSSTSELSPFGVAVQQQNPTWIAADGTSVYWVTRTNASGNINACVVASCTPVVLGSSPSPDAIVVDDVAIYWTDANGLGGYNGAIFKLAK